VPSLFGDFPHPVCSSRGSRGEPAQVFCSRLLGARFGELPAEVVARVGTATILELDRWAERILTAATLEAVLDER